ncbi:molecular chaperone DnaK [Methanosarcina sp. 1.H.T.1A.1]|uniref:molecular chaperone DnaK n=1 Tax=Methanosarcina sp. 1.H.T.1A.1 TaxID=1483602 RepID=UPI002285CDDB|nr:molecular chaperone DnaK [Methanosarcina sp. 1.H.T.1A.1]
MGIDLGTTNSCMAIIELGEPKVITNSEGKRLTPSVVGFSKKNELLVGELAKRQMISNHENTVQSIKRNMGKPDYRVSLNNEKYTPHGISAKILQKLKHDAEKYLGDAVEKAVITVPAYFNDSQRFATKKAGELAGLEVLRVINEPTAAALAYGLKDGIDNRKTLVYDLGGGTFDVSILKIKNGIFEVLATSGDTELGGDDFDRRVVEHLLAEFQKAEGKDLSDMPQAMQRVKEAAERCKIDLSTLTTANVNLPYIFESKTLEIDVTRDQFDRMTEDLVKKTLSIMEKTLQDGKLSPSEIDEVIFVGGSTRIPAVVKAVEEFMGKKALQNINPDEVVAMGAAVQAGILGNEYLKSPREEVDAGNLVLLDVTSLTLGFETVGDLMAPVIPRNTTIPTRNSKIFTTHYDNQRVVRGKILQGEERAASKNVTLGMLVLDNIPSAPKGIPRIEVTFDIDANGLINATAKDLGTGIMRSVTIERPEGLND